MYCKYNYHDLAADMLANHTELTFKYITDEEYEYIDSIIF